MARAIDEHGGRRALLTDATSFNGPAGSPGRSLGAFTEPLFDFLATETRPRNFGRTGDLGLQLEIRG